MLASPNSLHDVTEAQPRQLYNLRTGTGIESGSIISVTTHDPGSYPLPDRDPLRLQCNLIIVLRMAGRAGHDILKTYDSDSEVSSITTAVISQRNSSAHSADQVHSDGVIPTSASSRKIPGPFSPKLLRPNEPQEFNIFSLKIKEFQRSHARNY